MKDISRRMSEDLFEVYVENWLVEEDNKEEFIKDLHTISSDDFVKKYNMPKPYYELEQGVKTIKHLIKGENSIIDLAKATDDFKEIFEYLVESGYVGTDEKDSFFESIKENSPEETVRTYFLERHIKKVKAEKEDTESK